MDTPAEPRCDHASDAARDAYEEDGVEVAGTPQPRDTDSPFRPNRRPDGVGEQVPPNPAERGENEGYEPV